MTSKGIGEGENSCQTHRAILEAARGRFLHYGFKKTTIDEIAQDAGVGKGTVYLHFDSKEEILFAIVRDVKRNVSAQMRAIAASPLATPEEKLRRMLLTPILAVHDACSAAAHGIEFVDETMRPRVEMVTRDENEVQMRIIADVLREGIDRGQFSVPGGDVELAARHLKLALISFFPPRVSPCHGDLNCRVSLESRAQAMLNFLFDGVRRR